MFAVYIALAESIQWYSTSGRIASQSYVDTQVLGNATQVCDSYPCRTVLMKDYADGSGGLDGGLYTAIGTPGDFDERDGMTVRVVAANKGAYCSKNSNGLCDSSHENYNLAKEISIIAGNFKFAYGDSSEYHLTSADDDNNHESIDFSSSDGRVRAAVSYKSKSITLLLDVKSFVLKSPIDDSYGVVPSVRLMSDAISDSKSSILTNNTYLTNLVQNITQNIEQNIVEQITGQPAEPGQPGTTTIINYTTILNGDVKNYTNIATVDMVKEVYNHTQDNRKEIDRINTVLGDLSGDGDSDPVVISFEKASDGYEPQDYADGYGKYDGYAGISPGRTRELIDYKQAKIMEDILNMIVY